MLHPDKNKDAALERLIPHVQDPTLSLILFNITDYKKFLCSVLNWQRGAVSHETVCIGVPIPPGQPFCGLKSRMFRCQQIHREGVESGLGLH